MSSTRQGNTASRDEAPKSTRTECSREYDDRVGTKRKDVLRALSKSEMFRRAATCNRFSPLALKHDGS